MSADIVVFRHHTHYDRIAGSIIASEKRLLAEEMEADYLRICRDREAQRRESRREK